MRPLLNGGTLGGRIAVTNADAPEPTTSGTDAMMVLGAERDAHIAALEAPLGVVRLTRGEHVHPALDLWCRKLAFSLEPDDFAPPGVKLIPLWEGENSITGFYFSGANVRTFIRYDVEYIDQFCVVGSTIGEAIRDIILDYIEDEDVVEVLTRLGLPSLNLRRPAT